MAVAAITSGSTAEDLVPQISPIDWSSFAEDTDKYTTLLARNNENGASC